MTWTTAILQAVQMSSVTMFSRDAKGNKVKSELRGFVVPLRRDLHPNGVWFKRTPENLQIDKILKQRCQIYYESHYGTRYDFIKEFGKSYL